ncbi:hypothetical protein SASC598J21_019530 [Snodgrassella alvi SCGC AB-598-J21]|uniref:Uncharacterized protein n=1 Tax=Snodgrassella alvi SCGC AB-598-J21 TaxID=1385367 RepID=A0A074V8Q1_9NEIS|nr:hypothetical protein SASC598J21_019530 [Snodgrassella alvi SCGC AB-598-J21]
MLIMRINQSFD